MKDASPTSSPSEENVPEDSAESDNWEAVGRELLLQRLNRLELDFQEAIQEIRRKVKSGEDLSRMDYPDLQTAKHDAEDVMAILDELTEPFVFEEGDGE